ncbi:MAG: outer membrane protein transport protein [Myxococcota bacterium]
MISLLWATVPAFAGGYFYSDSGIVATGRGGAWIAGADTQFAQYYNPAGLIRVRAPTLNVGWSGVQQNVRFRRLDPDPAEGGPAFDREVHNHAAPFDVPELGFATPVLRDRLAVAFGFYSPFAPSSEYPEEGPQRYTIKDTEIYQFSIGPSAALKVHDTLTVGLGLQWQYLQIGETVDVTASGIDDPAGDIAVEARAADRFTPNANLGLLFEPRLLGGQPLSFGLALQPPTTFHARGSAALDFEGSGLAVVLDQTRYEDDDVALNIGLPWVVRAGVAVRPVPKLEIEGAVVWQDWSALEDIVVEDIDIEVQSAFIPEDQRRVDDRLSLPAGLHDTVSLRLGAELDVHEQVAVRAGGFWENAALGEDEVSVALVDTSKVQIGAGATVWPIAERLRFDVAFAWLFFRSLEIRDSTVKQIDAGVLDTTVPLVVGNGDLSSSGWVVGVAGSVQFGRRDGDG